MGIHRGINWLFSQKHSVNVACVFEGGDSRLERGLDIFLCQGLPVNFLEKWVLFDVSRSNFSSSESSFLVVGQ